MTCIKYIILYFGAFNFGGSEDFTLGPPDAYTLELGGHVPAHDIYIVLLDCMVLLHKVMQVTFQVFGWWKRNTDNAQDLPSFLDTVAVK